MMQLLLTSRGRLSRDLAVLAFLAGLLVPAGAGAQITVMEAGYSVTDLGGSVGAKGIECSPGGVWGDYMYVGDSVGDRVERIDFFGTSSTFAPLAPNAFPVGLEFGPGPAANFGDYLYVTDYGLSDIVKIDPTGTVTPFTVAVPSPGDCVFDPSGAYSTDLFVTTAFAGPIYTVDQFGVATSWATFPSLYMKFGPGGAWGTGMYATSGDAIGIVTVDMAGTPTNFCTGFTSPEGFDWAFGTGFDGDMFACDVATNEVWRIKSDGTRTLFASMVQAADVTFCNDALYLVGFHGGCYKVTHDQPVGVAFQGIEARADGDAVEVTWGVSADPGEILGFRVYRGDGDGADLQSIAGSVVLEPDRRSYRDASVQPGETYQYVIAVVTTYEHEIRSLPASVTTAALSLSMSQNYPNPFNPSTTIGYRLPEATDVRLSVYDQQGRLVADLVRGARAAGDHTADWNGRDARGNAVASGVYFYRLTAGQHSLTRKLVLLK